LGMPAEAVAFMDQKFEKHLEPPDCVSGGASAPRPVGPAVLCEKKGKMLARSITTVLCPEAHRRVKHADTQRRRAWASITQ
jgi:hypothetical protein